MDAMEPRPPPPPAELHTPGDPAAATATNVTHLLRSVAQGDPKASNALYNVVYEQLRRIAQARLGAERAGHTLQATALVHEAYLRLVGPQAPAWNDRAHFYRSAALSMRRILIDHARARDAEKRGGGRRALRIQGIAEVADLDDSSGILSLDAAIERLSQVDARSADIVRLRFYAGLSEHAVAEALGLSPRTVRRDWTFARAWLREALERELDQPGG